jgi:hypothetical protein
MLFVRVAPLPAARFPAGCTPWTVSCPHPTVALAKAAKNHEAKYGNRPGPQFMAEPEQPELDEKKEFWAHLAKAGGHLGNVNRHAGVVVGIGDYAIKGDVFVPVAGQYSFDPPF